MDRASEFCHAARAHNSDREKVGWRYPRKLRRLAIAYCRERREAGQPLGKIASDLGITAKTLGRWLATREPSNRSEAFHSVRVVAPAASPSPSAGCASSLSVVTPGGLRIEGLELSDVLELARVLG